MKLTELQAALRAADTGAVLVPPRILEQIIQEACNLRGSVWSPPHRQCYVVDRQTLFRHIEQAYLDLEPDQLLPDTVLLLARPPSEELSDLERKQVLLKYWRLLFHASVHFALDSHQKDSPVRLSPQRVQYLIGEVGRTQFEEIREILVQDRYLLATADDREVYIEFAAVYLETRYFAASLLPALFPGLGDFDRIDELLGEDVDAQGLFDRTRLKDAPDPVMSIDNSSEEAESLEQYWTLVRTAERASLGNDNVRAAILRTRAWRIAPAALGQKTREEAMADMRRLTARLATALRLSPEEVEEWGKDLPLLLDKADQGHKPAEARLLFDLQKICSDSERPIFAVDLVEWVLSAGKRPIKRALPSLRQVRLTRNLRNAVRYLAVVRLHDLDRMHFTELVQTALAKSEQFVRDQFGRVLTAALQDVGLNPRNPPERVALAKMVAEWVDRILAYGFMTFSDLRDTISRNQLKLPDLTDPRDLIRGDPLLRLDRRLASLLDGVYRPSDIYMRGLETLTAVNFGTRIGRAATLWLTIPFGAAALFLQAMGVLFHLLFSPDHHPGRLWFYHVLVGPSRGGGPSSNGPHLPFHFLLLGILTAFLIAVLHSKPFRLRCTKAIQAARHELHKAFVEFPRKIFQLASLQKFVRSWQFQVAWYVFKPLSVSVVIWFLLPRVARASFSAFLLFLITTLLLNSRLGKASGEAIVQGLKSLGKMLRAGLLVAVYRILMRVFEQVLDGVELVLFTVDDFLRYRTGDSRFSLVLRTILALLWFPFSYLARFFMLVLVEPGFNPAKAPVSYLAAKVMLPLAPQLTSLAAAGIRPVLGQWLAYAIAVPTIWLLPDVFGFLFWETKENWSLYRANRRKTLRSVPIGPKRETVKTLLLTGFHSGTIPRIYFRLREAERHASWARNWTDARACRQELEDISHSVERFISRELLAMLDESQGWQDQRVSVGRVDLTVKHIGFSLAHADYPNRPVQIDFELRKIWLQASVVQTGWLDQLTPAQLHAFTAALASLYKLAGVDLVCEQIQANLPTETSTWDVTAEGLILRLDPQSPPILYTIRDLDPLPQATDEGAAAEPLPVDPRQLIFARCPLNWYEWVSNWQEQANGDRPSRDWLSELVQIKPSAATSSSPEVSPSGPRDLVPIKPATTTPRGDSRPSPLDTFSDRASA